MAHFNDFNINLDDSRNIEPFDIQLIDDNNHQSLREHPEHPTKFCRMLQNSLIRAGFEWREITAQCHLSSYRGEGKLSVIPEDCFGSLFTLIPEDESFRMPRAYDKFFRTNGTYKHVPCRMLMNDDHLLIGSYQMTLILGNPESAVETLPIEAQIHQPWYRQMFTSIKNALTVRITAIDAEYEVLPEPADNIIPMPTTSHRR